MKWINLKIEIALIALMGTVVPLTLQAGFDVTLMDDTSKYSRGDGGEFRAAVSSGFSDVYNLKSYSDMVAGTVSSADNGSWGYNSGLDGRKYFQTFCIEYHEEFYPGASYTVSTSFNALYGHLGAPGTPVTYGTAWLYSQFALGGLATYDYNYGSGRTTSAGDLQQAIWFFQGERENIHNKWTSLALAELSKLKLNASDPSYGMWGVYALNLGDPGKAQDQLVMVGTSTSTTLQLSAVPEPSTLIAGALLLLPFCASTLRILRPNRGVEFES